MPAHIHTHARSHAHIFTSTPRNTECDVHGSVLAVSVAPNPHLISAFYVVTFVFLSAYYFSKSTMRIMQSACLDH